MLRDKIREVINNTIVEEGGTIGEYEEKSFLIVPCWNSIELAIKGLGEIEGLKEELEKEGFEFSFDDIISYLFDTAKYDSNWGFNDEYTTCQECNKVVRTSPDSYSWLPQSAIVNECELLCSECIKADPQSYIEGLVNNPKKANTILNDEELEEQGFTKLEKEYENGFYEGMNDEPQKIYEGLCSEYEEILFSITDSGQFHIGFVTYVKDKIEEEEE